MDTCYLCLINPRKKETGQAPLRKTTTDGFGTCRTCNVHACPKHGDRISAHFQCADCNAGTSVNAAMTPPQPGTRARPGGTDDEGAIAAQMVERGAAGFAALAPAVAIPATFLIEEGSAERMQQTLESLVRDYREHHRLGLAELVDQSIPERSDEQLALSLGLDEEAAAHVPLRGGRLRAGRGP